MHFGKNIIDLNARPGHDQCAAKIMRQKITHVAARMPFRPNTELRHPLAILQRLAA
jgi:hypothetical protein